MNGVSALFFIARATLRNMLLRQARRMREPRYLIATLFGLFYVGSVFLQPGLRAPRPIRGPAPEIVLHARTGGLAFVWMIFVLLGWLFGGDEGGLTFSEAEIQFLFPAPISRRQLIHYKLVRTLVLSLVSGLVLALTLGRRMATNGWLFVIGAWLGVATLSLHLVAASLTRQSLLEHGLRGPARRALALVVPAAMLASIAGGFLRVPLPWPSRWSEVSPYMTLLFHTPPLSWAMLPFAPAADVAMAAGVADLLPALPAAAGVLGLHYLWALSTDAAFEQASMAAAERRSRRVDRLRRGHVSIRAGARPPFALAARGHPAVAIYWKNLTAATRVLPVRLMIVVGICAFSGCVSALFAGVRFDRELGALLCALAATATTFFGVQVYRIDLRFDLPNLDILKSYPLRGRDLALAEVLAPFTVLTIVEWFFFAGAAALAPGEIVAGLGRLPLVATGMLLLPAVTLPGLLVQNGAALLFPAWVESGVTPPRGVEAIGQRMLTLLGTVFAMTLMLAPAAVLGVVAGAVLHGALGRGALPLGALVATAVVVGEGILGFLALGRAFERFDPARS